MSKWILAVVKYALHVAMGTLGVPIITAFSTFEVIGIVRHFSPQINPKMPYIVLTETPGFPPQIAGGLVIGGLFWIFSRRRLMFWAWIPSAIILLVMAAKFMLANTGCYSFLGLLLITVEHFGGGYRLASWRYFDQVTYSLPFAAVGAYSLGALLSSCIVKFVRRVPHK